MALFNGFLKKRYTATVYCNNCNSHSEVQVPRGVTVNQFIENGPCPACGCATLIADYRQIDEFKERTPQPKMQILRPRVTTERAPLPQPRPSTKPKGYKPLPQESLQTFEPRKIFKEDPVDFWTGKERTERPRRRRREEGEYQDESY